MILHCNIFLYRMAGGAATRLPVHSPFQAAFGQADWLNFQASESPVQVRRSMRFSGDTLEDKAHREIDGPDMLGNGADRHKIDAGRRDVREPVDTDVSGSFH